MIVKPRRQTSDADQRQSFVNGGTPLLFTADRQKREHGDGRRGKRDAAAPAPSPTTTLLIWASKADDFYVNL
jgi:hypothetical protein